VQVVQPVRKGGPAPPVQSTTIRTLKSQPPQQQDSISATQPVPQLCTKTTAGKTAENDGRQNLPADHATQNNRAGGQLRQNLPQLLPTQNGH